MIQITRKILIQIRNLPTQPFTTRETQCSAGDDFERWLSYDPAW